MTLLEETKQKIQDLKYDTDSIVFIGSKETGHSCTWSEFEKLADIEYNSGYGGQEIASDLAIVFADGMTMFRLEYYGSECWDYITPFVAPKPIATLCSGEPWATIEQMQDTDGDYS